jgi:hypothetical protein
VSTPKEKQEINHATTNPKGENHTHIIAPPTINIRETNNPLKYLSTINGFNSPIKQYKLIDRIHKQDPAFCCIQETHLNNKDRHYL